MTNRNMQSGKKWAAFWTGAIVFVIIVAVVAGVIGWRTSGYKDWTFGFGTEASKPDDKTPDDGNIVTGADGGAVISEIENNGLMLLSAELPRSAYAANGVSEQAEKAFTLTVTVTPAEADDKSIDWSSHWVDTTGAWVIGKQTSDYITITPKSDGATEAIVSCKEAFGQTIIIEAKSRANPRATASATCDYRKKLTASTYTIENQLTLDGSSSTKTWTWEQYDGSNTNSWLYYGSFNHEFSIGTLDDTITGHSIEVKVSEDLKTQLSTVFPSSSASSSYNSTITLNCGDRKFLWLNQAVLFGYIPSFSDSKIYSENLGLFPFVADQNDYADTQIVLSNFNKLATCMKAAATDLVVTINTNLTYGGTVSTTYNVNVSDDSLTIIVSNLTLDQNEIEF